MQGVLITNGGPHSAEDWAAATASHVVAIADHIADARRGAAIKLQAAVVDILLKYHAAIQVHEQKALKRDPDRLALDTCACEDHIEAHAVADEIIAAAVGTPWEADFAFAGQVESGVEGEADYKPRIASTHELLERLLASHFASAMHVERCWHADRNEATLPQAKAFNDKHFPGA